MSDQEATLAIVDLLEEAGVPYMLVGSFSSNFYGIPRATQDADFFVHLGDRSISVIAERLGPRFQFDPQSGFETVTATTKYIAKVVGEPFLIEFFLLGDDEHDHERFARLRRVAMFGQQVSVPTAEDVIITKLRWADPPKRSKDIDDVRGVIAVQGEKIDWQYVNAWCDRHGTRNMLEEIRRSITAM